AVKVGHEPARGAQERRLATPREAGEQAELPGPDLEADPVERRRLRARVAIADALEGEHGVAHGSIPRRSMKGASATAGTPAQSAAARASSTMCTVGYAVNHPALQAMRASTSTAAA